MVGNFIFAYLQDVKQETLLSRTLRKHMLARNTGTQESKERKIFIQSWKEKGAGGLQCS